MARTWRVEVTTKPDLPDFPGESVRRAIADDLGIEVRGVRLVDVYTIRKGLDEGEIERVARELLTDPITQVSDFRETVASGFGRAVEVGYKPEVTDNVGTTTVEAISDLLDTAFVEGEGVRTSRLYLMTGDIDEATASVIAKDMLANTLIEYYRIWDEAAWRDAWGGEHFKQFVDAEEQDVKVADIDLEVPDGRLTDISREGVLSLSLAEMQRIRDYYRRDDVRKEREELGLPPRPTDVELEMLAQTWSEHCKHKIFNARITYEEPADAGAEGRRKEVIESLFDSYIRRVTDEVAKEKDWLVSVFTDNAGVIDFDGERNAVFKVETHNHPSALDPYGGAITGIVGVNRDPMGTGLGAELIFNTDVFCFGPPDFPPERLKPGILHPKRIFKGVRKGVEHGGNKIGIPTVNGTIVFDEAYVYNPLVYCGTGGIMPKTVSGRPSHEKTIAAGAAIVMVGGRIGKDGIHGATFSSVKLEETTSSQAVQIGAPIVQKKMMDALVEARDAGLYTAITDNGAGGLSSSVGEMSELCGGCRVDLSKAPVKYAGLMPWELWVSEAQERMTVAVPPDKVEAFLELMARRDVEATVLGEFADDGRLRVTVGDRAVAHLEMDFLHGGLPRMELTARWTPPSGADPEIAPPETGALTEELMLLLADLNVCSKEWVVRQYDHEVQAQTVVKPLTGAMNDGPSDAAVVRPVYGRPHGLVVSNGIKPRYGLIDPYWMAAGAIDEAIRNIVAVGGDPERIALLDNFCWGNPILSDDNPDGDFKLAQLVRAARACYETAAAFGAPFISGKDSFHNEYELDGKTVSIPPTLLISALGVIPDCGKAITMDGKRAGDFIYVLGKTYPELGGSQYLELHGELGVSVPKVDAARARRLYGKVFEACQAGLVASCHDCSDGGLAVAVSETVFAGGLGAQIYLRKLSVEGFGDDPRDDFVLFSESHSRLVVTVPADKATDFEVLMNGEDCSLVGEVTDVPWLRVNGFDGHEVLAASVADLKDAWQGTLRW